MGHMKDLLITVYGGGDEAVAAAEKLTGLNRWIPVTERLPADGEWVLWFNSSLRCPVLVANRDGESLDWGGDLLDSIRGFTHWMPLPEPPNCTTHEWTILGLENPVRQNHRRPDQR